MSTAPIPQTRSEVVWSAKWWIVAAALVAALLVGWLTSLKATTYTATASVRVTVPQAKGVPQQSALASVELAAQYAQLATTMPVINAAEKELGRANGLASSISASPINNYNIIGVTASAPTADLAAAEAGAVANALVEYVQLVNSDIVVTAGDRVATQLKGLNAQISAIRKKIANVSPNAAKTGSAGDLARVTLASQQQLLSSLLSLQQASINGSTGDIVVAQPSVAVVDLPKTGSPQKPKILLYALAAGLAALLGLSELAVFKSKIRDLAARRRVAEPPTEQIQGDAPLSALEEPASSETGTWPALNRVAPVTARSTKTR